ncbi:hypothetical protein B0H66DRAFT_142454 [Apodospora peruviana]|uniref:Uncharacterized protein n=1 Tax=Apodospora peruviana TaxID=516989 RepID=A0AAE0IJ19_9PEZI|nr:hypothetical protein B0H66DRAFT_142454 [Apodospora peruviana]
MSCSSLEQAGAVLPKGQGGTRQPLSCPTRLSLRTKFALGPSHMLSAANWTPVPGSLVKIQFTLSISTKHRHLLPSLPSPIQFLPLPEILDKYRGYRLQILPEHRERTHPAAISLHPWWMLWMHWMRCGPLDETPFPGPITTFHAPPRLKSACPGRPRTCNTCHEPAKCPGLHACHLKATSPTSSLEIDLTCVQPSRNLG